MGTLDATMTTPLDALHRRLGAKMVDFAGYAMPLQYAEGIIAEHLHCRARAALFDVSHMGQIELRPRSGDLAAVAAALETLVPANLVGLAPGRQRYGLFTEPGGGILDDLMIGHLGDRLLVVANAARKRADLEHLTRELGKRCDVLLREDRGLVALQGPEAEAVLARHAPEVAAMRFQDIREVDIAGIACTVSRSGYTGEDGFEIGMPAEEAETLAETLLAEPEAAPAGLGARDTLRLEAGLCLHGADIHESVTPVEASLAWAIPPVRRKGGAREGGFPGAEVILAELDHGPARRRVGLRPEGRAPVRGGAPLFARGGETALGEITSGGFSPSLGAPVAMGFVPAAQAREGTALEAELRGRRVGVAVAALPFVPHRFKRS